MGKMNEPDVLSELAAELSRTRSEARLARRSYQFTVTFVIAAIALGGWLLWNDHQADVARDQADRQYELDQCERGNVTRNNIADIVDTQTEALIAASTPPDGSVSSSRQRAFDTYRGKVDPIVSELREPRECAALLEENQK